MGKWADDIEFGGCLIQDVGVYVKVLPPKTMDTPEAATAGVRRNEIFGTGEMAERTRAFDWSKTPVGPVEQWPDALLITVNTMLASRHPMFLWWGKELDPVL